MAKQRHQDWVEEQLRKEKSGRTKEEIQKSRQERRQRMAGRQAQREQEPSAYWHTREQPSRIAGGDPAHEARLEQIRSERKTETAKVEDLHGKVADIAARTPRGRAEEEEREAEFLAQHTPQSAFQTPPQPTKEQRLSYREGDLRRTARDGSLPMSERMAAAKELSEISRYRTGETIAKGRHAPAPPGQARQGYPQTTTARTRAGTPTEPPETTGETPPGGFEPYSEEFLKKWPQAAGAAPVEQPAASPGQKAGGRGTVPATTLNQRWGSGIQVVSPPPGERQQQQPAQQQAGAPAASGGMASSVEVNQQRTSEAQRTIFDLAPQPGRAAMVPPGTQLYTHGQTGQTELMAQRDPWTRNPVAEHHAVQRVARQMGGGVVGYRGGAVPANLVRQGAFPSLRQWARQPGAGGGMAAQQQMGPGGMPMEVAGPIRAALQGLDLVNAMKVIRVLDKQNPGYNLDAIPEIAATRLRYEAFGRDMERQMEQETFDKFSDEQRTAMLGSYERFYQKYQESAEKALEAENWEILATLEAEWPYDGFPNLLPMPMTLRQWRHLYQQHQQGIEQEEQLRAQSQPAVPTEEEIRARDAVALGGRLFRDAKGPEDVQRAYERVAKAVEAGVIDEQQAAGIQDYETVAMRIRAGVPDPYGTTEKETRISFAHQMSAMKTADGMIEGKWTEAEAADVFDETGSAREVVGYPSVRGGFACDYAPLGRRDALKQMMKPHEHNNVEYQGLEKSWRLFSKYMASMGFSEKDAMESWMAALYRRNDDLHLAWNEAMGGKSEWQALADKYDARPVPVEAPDEFGELEQEAEGVLREIIPSYEDVPLPPDSPLGQPPQEEHSRGPEHSVPTRTMYRNR